MNAPLDPLDLEDRPLIDVVSCLYSFMLGRPADPVGLHDFVWRLKRGSGLAELVQALQSGEEFLLRKRSGAFQADHILSILERRAAIQPALAQSDWLAREIAWFVQRRAALEPPSVLSVLGLGGVEDPAAYRWWLDEFERPRLARWAAAPPADGASFSVVVPAGATAAALVASVTSIQQQCWGAVEIVVLLAAHAAPDIVAVLAPLAAVDRRVLAVAALPGETPAMHLARALDACRGDFVGRLACGDRLSPIATAEFAAVCRDRPDIDLLFADSDTIDADGVRTQPAFRATWDPDLALATDFPGPLVLYSRGLWKRLGGGRGLDGEQIWNDLRLRAAMEVSSDRASHVPWVLCHKSVTAQADAAGGLALVQQAVNHGCLVTAGRMPGSVRIIHPLPWPAPLISLLIPTVGREELLRPCLEGIARDTAYYPLEVVVVDNGPDDLAAQAWFRDATAALDVRVIRWDRPFNWGTVNNVAAAAARGELLVLVNDDTTALEPGWLEELARQALRPDVGIVGARLLYPDGSIQHAGIAVDSEGQGHHVMRFAPPDAIGYQGRLQVVHEVSAVTGACMAMRKAVFDAAGGIEDTMLQVTSSDVDLCFRVARCGYRILWTPYATLLHRELATRGSDDAPEKIRRANAERLFLKRSWAGDVANEAFWSPNLAISEKTSPDFAVPPRPPRSTAPAQPERPATRWRAPPGSTAPRRSDSWSAIRHQNRDND